MRSKKGKRKAIEEDPIDFYDDMYADDLDDSHFDAIPELNVPSPAVVQNLSASTSIARPLSSTVATTSRTPPSPPPQTTTAVPVDSDEDKVTVLYKKMLILRDKVYISGFGHYLFTLIRICVISQIMLETRLSDSTDVFPDHVLALISAMCPEGMFFNE